MATRRVEIIQAVALSYLKDHFGRRQYDNVCSVPLHGAHYLRTINLKFYTTPQPPTPHLDRKMLTLKTPSLQNGKENDNLSKPTYSLSPQQSSTPSNDLPNTSHSKITRAILEDLNFILNTGDYARLSHVMLKQSSWWRDHLCLSSDLRTFAGPGVLANFLSATTKDSGGFGTVSLSLNGDTTVSTLNMGENQGTIDCLKSSIAIRTRLGRGKGVVRLVKTSNRDHSKRYVWKIVSLFTSLDSLDSDLGTSNGGLRESLKNSRCTPGYEIEIQKRELSNLAPVVLVVGAGHCGLISAARLEALGVSTLVIERHEKVAGSWHDRYDSLKLHDPSWLSALPSFPFPLEWPVYASKDQVANWLEQYAREMKLDISLRTTIIRSDWDDSTKRWTVIVKRRGGSGEEEMFKILPKHIIQATGLAGAAHVPNVGGLGSFKGCYYHSSEFKGVKGNLQGRRIAVVGAGNSAHDVSRDCKQAGAIVTLVQRSSTYVISLASTRALMASNYRPLGPPLEDADINANSLPLVLRVRDAAENVKLAEKYDDAMIKGLQNAGFNYTRGMQDAGISVNVLQRSGGYYIDTGCSQLIADGQIKVKSGHSISHLDEDGIIFDDNSRLDVDEVVFATGFTNIVDSTRSIFGNTVADAVGPIWGTDDEGEVRGVWRPTGQPGLWIAAGSFNYARYHSKLLALQIKSREIGLYGS